MKNQTKSRTSAESLPAPQTDPMLYTLFLDTIRDLYWAENHLVKVLPKMAASASSKALKNAIDKHRGETTSQVSRLEKIFELLEEKAIAKKCDAMEGLAKEGETIIETTPAGTQTRDLGIIFAGQKVEHYEIASYIGAYQLAEKLGLKAVASVLQETLKEEQRTDALLSEMAGKILGMAKA